MSMTPKGRWFPAPRLQVPREKQGNTPAQYVGKIDKNGRFELVLKVFCGYPTSRCPSAKRRKKVLFYPNQRPGLFVLVTSVDELVYAFPDTGVDDFVR